MVLVTQRNFSRSGFLEFEDLPKLLFVGYQAGRYARKITTEK